MAETYKVTGQSRIVLYASEFKVLMNTLTQSNSMIEDLTDLYGCKDKFVYDTKSRGKEVIDFACINLIGCSIPEWLTSSKGSEFINTGFGARTLFIHASDTERRFHIPARPIGFSEMEADLIHDLQEISLMKGEFTFSNEAEMRYKSWYDKRENFIFEDERLGTYGERKAIHMVKIAMLLRANKSNSLVLELDDVEGAISAVESIEAGISETYRAIAHHDVGMFIERILAQLAKSEGGRMTFRDLLRKNYHLMSRDQLSEALETLVSSERVRVGSGEVGRGRSATYYELMVD
jgi:hypothetical protein